MQRLTIVSAYFNKSHKNMGLLYESNFSFLVLFFYIFLGETKKKYSLVLHFQLHKIIIKKKFINKNAFVLL